MSLFPKKTPEIAPDIIISGGRSAEVGSQVEGCSELFSKSVAAPLDRSP